MGKTLKHLCGSALTVAAIRSGQLIPTNRKITRTVRHKSKNGSEETTEEYKRNSVVGGMVRGMFTYLFVKGAVACCGEDASDTIRRSGDSLAKYVDRVRSRES